MMALTIVSSGAIDKNAVTKTTETAATKMTNSDTTTASAAATDKVNAISEAIYKPSASVVIAGGHYCTTLS